MERLHIPRPGVIELFECPIPEPAPGEVLIQVMASGICGTDIHIFNGEYLGDYPVIPGHEFAGIITAVGSQVTRFKAGDRVAVEPNLACDNCMNCLNNRQNFCLNWQAIGVTLPGGMQQYACVPEKAAFEIGTLPFEAGAFMEPLSCVLHGMERAGLELADQVAILGAGPIGCLLLQVALLQGASRITMLESNPGRAELARSLGASQVVGSPGDLQAEAYDLVIDASGVLSLMNQSVDLARRGGRVLLFGVPPAGRNLEVEAFKIFQKGLTLLSSFTSVRNSFQALDMLRSGRLQVAPLISHRLPLMEFSNGIDLIARHDPGVRKVMIFPNG